LEDVCVIAAWQLDDEQVRHIVSATRKPMA
jgi:hypothetical protein